MTKIEILAEYRNLSSEDRHSFERWLRANTVVGSMFALALVAFAVAGLRIETVPATSAPGSAQAVSIQELHLLAHLENLPVDHIHDQALVFAAPEPEMRSAMLSEGKGEQP
jgi:hypothetical protein